jgi:DNA-directed RNA polymerase subunit F
MKPEIISETPISSYQLKDELDKIKKRDKELNFRSAKSEEHLISLSPAQNKDSVYDKIEKLKIPRLKEQHIRKILDTMPTSLKDIKLILQGYTVNINNDNLTKIIDILAKS